MGVGAPTYVAMLPVAGASAGSTLQQVAFEMNALPIDA